MLESRELLHGRQRSSWLLVSLKDGLDRKVLAFRNLMFALALQKGSSILQTETDSSDWPTPPRFHLLKVMAGAWLRAHVSLVSSLQLTSSLQ